MFRVWIKDHKLPIGANSEETVNEITEVYGKENVELVEEISKHSEVLLNKVVNR